MWPLVGLLIGIALGLFLKIPIPPIYAKYLGVATLAALDSAFGGIRASLEKEFNDKLFISGFFSNTILAAFIVYMGDRLGVEPLYYAAIVAFGVRLFQNIAAIRRIFFESKRWGKE